MIDNIKEQMNRKYMIYDGRFYVHCLEVIEMMINPEMQLEWFSHLSSSRNVLGSLFTYQKGKC